MVGLAKNNRLKREIAEQMTQAEAAFNDTGKPARVFKDFRYRTRDSWSCERRVIGKAEFLEKGANPRFVAPSTSLFEIYKRFLCVADRHGPHIRLASIASAQVCLRASRHAILSPTMRQLTLFDSHKSLTPAPSAPLPS